MLLSNRRPFQNPTVTMNLRNALLRENGGMRVSRLFLAALSFTAAAAFAGNCVPATTANATEVFDTAHDGSTCLQWDVYLPASLSTPRPVVLVAHIGVFRAGCRSDSGVVKVAKSLSAAGFIACAIDYRLDDINNGLGVPTNGTCGATSVCAQQPTPAYAPGIGEAEVQVSDVRKAIVAARHPATCSLLYMHVNGKVGIVGGSSGASHALDCAATFSQGGGNRPDAVVCLSGAYKFGDQESLTNADSAFRCGVHDYCHITSAPCISDAWLDDSQLHDGSPVYRVGADCAPVYAFGSMFDSITPSQLTDLQQFGFGPNNLTAPDHMTEVVDGRKHAFAYWDDIISSGHPVKVSAAAQDWLAERLGLITN